MEVFLRVNSFIKEDGQMGTTEKILQTMNF